MNSGIEQERLNDVVGAHVRITSLVAAAGPAVELLEYLHPRDGRALPADARANDLVHWQTIMTGDVARALPAMPTRAGEMNFVLASCCWRARSALDNCSAACACES